MKMQQNFSLNIFLCIAAFGVPFLISCGNSGPSKFTDTPTSGSIRISADESLKPIVDAEKEVFESEYPQAHLDVIYVGEQDAIDLALKDSVRMAIVSRDLKPNEASILKESQRSYHSSKVAYDALAFIINRKNNDSVFGVDQVRGILEGRIKNWKDMGKDRTGEIRLVFDNPSSGGMRMLEDSLLRGKKPSCNCFAVHSNTEVIHYVEQNENAMGVIGVSWISDTEDSMMLGFMKRIRVAEVIPIDIVEARVATFKPIQANIMLRQYPFWRAVYTITREPHTGLGTGFAAFIASDPGQRIILKAGLVPARAPGRLVEIH